jgi:hypothetical protein
MKRTQLQIGAGPLRGMCRRAGLAKTIDLFLENSEFLMPVIELVGSVRGQSCTMPCRRVLESIDPRRSRRSPDLFCRRALAVALGRMLEIWRIVQPVRC